MEFICTSIPDVLIVEPKVFGDERGFFMETYHARLFAKEGINATFVQDNPSGSRRGTLRGLHYQIKQAQGKLVRAIAGEIFDVVVDLRCSSPTFGKWEGTFLSAQNKRQLWVPAGFAHGFYVLSEWAEFCYKVTDYYAPKWERCLLWSDPAVGIKWPLIENQELVISAKDAQGKLLKEAELYE